MPDRATPRVMIVEDEGIVARDLARCLARRGFEVAATVDTARAAVERAARGDLSLVLMDVMLKEEHDGIWAAERIRQDHNLPIVFLTAYGDPGTVERAQHTAPYAYVVKPFKDEDLLRTLDVALTLHSVQVGLCRQHVRGALERLSAALAHEARNPLFGITASVEALNTSLANWQEFTRHGELIASQAQRLNGLLSQLEELGRPAGPHERRSVGDLATLAVRSLQPPSDGKRVRLEVDPALEASGESRRLILALRCLLNDALEKCHPAAGVLLRAEQSLADGRQWIVCDVCVEFAAADAARMPAGGRTEFPLADHGDSLSLDLSIAQQVAGEHGGSVSSFVCAGSVGMRLRIPEARDSETTGARDSQRPRQ